MKLNQLMVILIIFLTSINAYGSSYPINQDTINFDRKQFKRSLVLKNAIDSIYEHKKENFSAAIKQISYMYNRAVDIRNKELQAKATNVKAGIFEDLGDYETALNLHYQALSIFENSGNKFSIAMVNNNIGRVYLEYGRLEDALSYLSKAEKLAKAGNFDKVLIYAYTNLANFNIQQNKLHEALEYGFKADSLCKVLKEVSTRPTNLNNIGGIYFFLNDYNKALIYYQKAKNIALQVKDSTMFYRSIINISEVDDLNHNGNPITGYEEALHYFSKIKDYSTVAYIANALSSHYQKDKNHELALKYYKQEMDAREKNKNLKAINNIALLQIKYETEKKQQEIKLLNSENTIHKLSIVSRNKTIAIISGLLFISIIISALVYSRRNIKQKAALEKQLFRHQNLLAKAVINAEEHERKRIASDLHDGVGQLFSAVKMNLNGLFNRIEILREEDQFLAEKTLALVEESCKEVRVISHQMMPNTLLKSGIASDIKSFIEKLDATDLKVNFSAQGFSDQLEHDAEVILYKVIQELLSNIIKHAKATELTIDLINQKNSIKVFIEDNGVGFSTANLNNYEGIGLKNIKTRIDYLRGTIQYRSSPNLGTSVDIFVPTNI